MFDWDEISIGLQVVLITILITVIASAVLFIPLNAISHHQCELKSAQMGFGYEYSFYKDCMIEYEPGSWLPIDNYIVNQPTGD